MNLYWDRIDEIAKALKENQVVIVTGDTGSGKSTILELIGRLYDAQKGVIEIDGVDIKNLN